MKRNIQRDGKWYRWDETCNRCGTVICDHNLLHSQKPDTDEVDFCSTCMRHLIDNNIPYETAKSQYKSNDSKETKL